MPCACWGMSDFPVLIRLKSGNFNFAETQSDGRDIPFTTAAGAGLPYQIKQWDSSSGNAAVWIKIPTITGNTTQEIKMYWGNSAVTAVSSGASVFNATNGYASVLHMGDTLADEVGRNIPTNVNTTASEGLIGMGRTFAAGQGVACGKTITASMPLFLISRK